MTSNINYSPHFQFRQDARTTGKPANMDAWSTYSTGNLLIWMLQYFFYPKVAMFGLLLRIQCNVGISQSMALAARLITKISMLQTPSR